MKDGAVVLSDIAASTLGIALFVLLFAFALQNETASPPTPVQMRGEITSTFKTLTARPTRAQDMVSALYARSATLDADQMTIDVFSDRVEIRTRIKTQRPNRHTLFLSDPDFYSELRNQIAQNQGQNAKLYLFVFSNRTLNGLYDVLSLSGAGGIHTANVILVPAALRSVSATGTQGWTTRFQKLTTARMTRGNFERSLRQLLLGRQPDGPTHGGTAATASKLGLVERLARWWTGLTICATLLVPAWFIRRVECRTRDTAR